MNKKSVLFSPIGTTDPIRSQSDGAMLHIVRHLRPEAVWLFLTKEMAQYHDMDDRYRKSILRVMPECQIEIIRTDIQNPQDFDACYVEFRQAIKNMRNKYKDYELLVNISSGTPQMKNILAYEAVAGNFGVVGIQVRSPNNGANDREEHLTTNFDLELAFETNQDHKIPAPESRIVRPDFKAINAYNLAFKIDSMINSYNYSGALNLLINNDELFDEKLKIILKHGDLRRKFQYDESFAIINNDKMKKYKDRIWCINDRNALKFYEFFMTMKLCQIRGELSEMILKLTPFSFGLAFYYLSDVLKFDLQKVTRVYRDNQYILNRDMISKYDINMLAFLDAKYKNAFRDSDLSLDNIVYILEYLKADVDIYDKFMRLREVESEVRNKVAHQMISVTEDKITRHMESREMKASINLPKNSSRIIELCESLLKLIFKNKIRSDGFIYDRINEVVRELLV
ncbi:MAG: CRISPR-associated protein (Cas_Csm6) [Firmicutes bacterium ADurb.Bin419]|nr:MAG: CRISPR-associated protein (Cas_Csm6) [Firmicutes bacterium ADurb.Bin419]